MGDFRVVDQETRSTETYPNQIKPVGIVRDILT